VHYSLSIRLYRLFTLDFYVQFKEASSSFHWLSFSCHGLCWFIQFNCQSTIFSRCYLRHQCFRYINTLVSFLQHVCSLKRIRFDVYILVSIVSRLLLSSLNYELYFGFSWIFAFISLDRWIKVEWPTKSQRLCTRKRFVYLCFLTLAISLTQNIVYVLACYNDACKYKNIACEIFVHTIYISLYMTVPIAIILVSICRTCLITLHVKKRFRTSNSYSKQEQRQPIVSSTQSNTCNYQQTLLDSNSSPRTVIVRSSCSFVSSPSITTSTTQSTTAESLRDSRARLANYTTYMRRRRSGLDSQMVVLISINVVPFILVHIVTEIAYLIDIYSTSILHSKTAKLLIILIYLSWYLISATRFYTNCLLSRIYREEFHNRLHMLRYGCKPRIVLVNGSRRGRHSSKYYIATGTNARSSTFVPAIDDTCQPVL
jgi:hypothetical protein